MADGVAMLFLCGSPGDPPLNCCQVAFLITLVLWFALTGRRGAAEWTTGRRWERAFNTSYHSTCEGV